MSKIKETIFVSSLETVEEEKMIFYLDSRKAIWSSWL